MRSVGDYKNARCMYTAVAQTADALGGVVNDAYYVGKKRSDYVGKKRSIIVRVRFHVRDFAQLNTIYLFLWEFRSLR